MAKVGASLSGKSQSTVLLPLFLRAACSGGGSPPSAGTPLGDPVKLQSLETTKVAESAEFVGTLEPENRLIWRPETDGRVIRFWILGRGFEEVSSGIGSALDFGLTPRINPREQSYANGLARRSMQLVFHSHDARAQL
jgi:hypothetical protein